jgi:hypothetical protein
VDSVLIRTSNREEGFKRVVSQIPKESLIIVSVDSDVAKEYAPKILKGRRHKIVEVNPDLHYNEYFQFLYPHAEGFIHHMDDDDYYEDFSKTKSYLKEPKIYVFPLMKFRHGVWKQSPRKSLMRKGKIQLGQICTANVVVHSSMTQSKWGAHSGGDFVYIEDMLKRYKAEFINDIISYSPVKGRGQVWT